MPTQIHVPPLGESVVEATVIRWLKKAGDRVNVGETIVELETEKVNVEVPADATGVIDQIEHHEGDTVHPGDTLGTIRTADETDAEPPRPASAGAVPDAAAQSSTAEADGLRVSSVAQRMAAELGVDLRQVPGTGPGGRVMKEDVLTFAQQAAAPAAKSPAPAAPSPAPQARPAQPAAPAPQPPTPSGRPEIRQKLSRRRQTIARRLVEAQQTAAMLTTFNEVDMSAVMALRQRWRDSFKERHNIGLGFMSFFVKAAVGALKAFPQINAELQGDELILKQYYDIGIAIGDPEGLVVPVLRDADRLTFAGIETAIAGYVQKSREKRLTLEELRGGTFTITNGGIFGSLLSTPILNPPQVAILGMHKIEDRPVVMKGEIAVRPMMYLALSYDHRVVDGRDAVLFLVRVKELIEDPESLLLES